MRLVVGYIAIYLLWLFPYILDLTKLGSSTMSMVNKAMQICKDLEWAPDSKNKMLLAS